MSTLTDKIISLLEGGNKITCQITTYMMSSSITFTASLLYQKCLQKIRNYSKTYKSLKVWRRNQLFSSRIVTFKFNQNGDGLWSRQHQSCWLWFFVENHTAKVHNTDAELKLKKNNKFPLDISTTMQVSKTYWLTNMKKNQEWQHLLHETL